MESLMIAVRLGWRNMWRNPRRSAITFSAIAAAFAFLIALIGLMEGLKEQLIVNGTLFQLGHFQIHDRAYLPDRNVNDTIGGYEGVNIPDLLDLLRRDARIESVSPRVYGFGLLSTGEYSSGVQILGVDLEAEAAVTNLLGSLRQGKGLAEYGSHSLVIGHTLADEIHARLGSEVAVVTQAADGTLGNDLFRVAGIIRTGLNYLDRSLVIMQIGDLQDLLALTFDRVHEVAARIGDPLAADAICLSLNNSDYLPHHAIAQSWGELSPQLRDYMNLAEGANAFMIFLVAIFAAFGVLNTMMMAVFERTREIGMLGAMGMRPVLILTTILFESLFLAALGLAIGFGLGSLMMSYLTTHGWDLSQWVGEMSMLNTRMDPVIRGSWQWDQVLWAAAGLTIATLLAAVFPARRVAWKKPVEALSAPTEN